MKKGIVFALATMFLLTSAAMGEHYSYSYPITVTDTQGQAVENVSALDVLAIAEDGTYLVFAQDKIITMDADALSKTLEGEELPQVPDTKTNIDMNNTEMVTALQQGLIDAGYLEGKADGVFGSQSLKALQTMQETYGIPTSNGKNSIAQYVLTALQAINGKAEGNTNLVGTMPAMEVVFEPILNKTNFDLEPLYNSAFVFNFDEMEDKGSVVMRESFSWKTEDAAEIDAMQVKITLGWSVANKGGYTISPVMYVTTTGARSFMPRQMILKSGDQRTVLSVDSVTKVIDNGKVTETVAFSMNDDLLAMWQSFASDDMKIRLTGKYRSVDFAIVSQEFAFVSDYLDAYSALCY